VQTAQGLEIRRRVFADAHEIAQALVVSEAEPSACVGLGCEQSRFTG
jgi:hypothetical protein